MADYDVGVVSLTTPAPAAPLAQCRPVVSVRNNGIHDAVASGYIRIYAAGLKIYESEAYSDTIAPGETRPCSAVDYWTPPAEGPYTVQGYVTCPLDQVEPNNNLWPVTVNISGVVPPPPTPVALHASQHESGGEDEMSLEGLPGRAADEQTPINHASFHENGGIDRIDVTGLPGVLGSAQTPKSHAAAHKVGGSDQVDVLALPNATALELVARKGAANGYPGLNTTSRIPHAHLGQVPITPTSEMVLRYDTTDGGRWAYAPPPNCIDSTLDVIDVTAAGPTTILEASEDSQPAGSSYLVSFEALVNSIDANTITVRLLAGVSAIDLEAIATATFSALAGAAGKKIRCAFEAQKLGIYLRANGSALTDLSGTPVPSFPTTTYKYIGDAAVLRLSVQLASAIAGTHVIVYNAVIRKYGTS